MYFKLLSEVCFKHFSIRTEAYPLPLIDEMVEYSEIDRTDECIGQNTEYCRIIPFVKGSFGVIPKKKLQSDTTAFVIGEKYEYREQNIVEKHRCSEKKENDCRSEKHLQSYAWSLFSKKISHLFCASFIIRDIEPVPIVCDGKNEYRPYCECNKTGNYL